MGFLVILEGIDGSGKTSVARALHETLVAAGRDAVLTGEPTRTWLGDAVRAGIARDTDAVTESFLFLADREAHTAAIREWLAAGKVVVCDRYTDSTLAYQGARLEGVVDPPLDWLRALGRRVAVEPDAVLLLRMDADEALRRVGQRGARVRFEEVAFLRRVAAVYDGLAAGNPRYRVLDAARPLDEVVREAAGIVTQALHSPRGP